MIELTRDGVNDALKITLYGDVIPMRQLANAARRFALGIGYNPDVVKKSLGDFESEL